MRYIKIDGEKIDPYFILGVTEDDSDEKLYKMYKQKAKILHPDKAKGRDKKLCEKNFRILKESYEFIKDEKRGKNNNDIKKLREVKREKYKEEESKNFKTKKEKEIFDKNYEKKREKLQKPEDFGHKNHKRIKDVKEYDNLNVDIDKILDKFSNKKFNKLFEYFKYKNKKEDDKEKGLIHKTSDGFFAHNSGITKQMPVSVYNGLLLAGDDYGDEGKGYYGDDYADYLEVLNAIKNPRKGEIDIKKILRQKIKKEEIKKRNLEELQEKINIPRGSFVRENENFELNKSKQIREEIDRAKNLIMKYKDIFGDELIDQAQRGLLEMSPDTFGDEFNDRLRIEENLTRSGYRKNITY